jgi:hypothetical protein
VSRTVVDKQGRMLFTYDIEASPEGAPGGRYTIRIKPHDPNKVNLYYLTLQPGDQIAIGDTPYTVRPDGKIAGDRLGEIQAAGLTVEKLMAAVRARVKDQRIDYKVISARRDVPTVAAVREFKSVRIGEAVSIDILINPSTGERIYDVIQPIVQAPQQTAVREKPQTPLEDEFSLMKIRVTINGKTVEEPNNSWLIGGAIKMSIPGHGAVYLAIKPITSYAFQPVGRAERGKLTFPIGSDFIEITGGDNIMKKSPYRTIWVYWDAGATTPASLEIAAADNIEWLLPKK